MKTIFEKSVREEVIQRINSLNINSKAQWGKMNIYQMLKHCTLWEEMIHGDKKYERVFIGRLFGKLALKSVLKDEMPLGRNSPTIPQLVIRESGDVEHQKKEWIARIEKYENFSNPGFVHVFFGKMTEEQTGYMVYKHVDHHLRQFGA